MDQSIYKSTSLAIKYVNEGKNDQAIEQLKVFAMQDNYQYWILVFMEIDPLLKPLKSHPEYEEVNKKIKDRFWENQTKLKVAEEKSDLRGSNDLDIINKKVLFGIKPRDYKCSKQLAKNTMILNQS